MSTPRNRLLLHVGMHKTGSSSIQHRLASAPGVDFDYLDLGRGPNHGGAMFAAFDSAPENYDLLRRLGTSAEEARAIGDEVRRRLAERLARPGPRLRIVSGEAITLIDPAGLERLREFVLPLATLEVLAYVRPPRSFMESAFQQRVRGGTGTLNFASLYPVYRKRFLKFEQVFGRSRMRLVPFDVASFRGRDVVADLCDRLGVPAPEGPPAALNSAQSRRATSLLYTYRKFGATAAAGQAGIRDSKAMVLALQSLRGPKLRFAGAHVAEVLARFANDRRWVEARLRAKLDEGEEPEGDHVVREEADLFRYDAHQLEWLRQWGDHPLLSPRMGPQDVAGMMHAALPGMVEQFREWKRSRAAVVAGIPS